MCLYVRVYMCVFIGFVCLNACVHLYASLCVCACVCVCMYMHMSIHTRVYSFVCVCALLDVFMCMGVCECGCMNKSVAWDRIAWIFVYHLHTSNKLLTG